MGHSLQEVLDAVERNPYSNSEDKTRQRNNVMRSIMYNKQNELDQVKIVLQVNLSNGAL